MDEVEDLNTSEVVDKYKTARLFYKNDTNFTRSFHERVHFKHNKAFIASCL